MKEGIMNGYEFTRFEANYINKVKAGAYDASTIAFQIEYNNPGTDFRTDADYVDASHWMIDSTMSCDQEEAINWMTYYMSNAIAYGIETKNLDWRTKFLAAYDLFNELTEGKSTRGNEFYKFQQAC